jgi:hypothetical protein
MTSFPARFGSFLRKSENDADTFEGKPAEVHDNARSVRPSGNFEFQLSSWVFKEDNAEVINKDDDDGALVLFSEDTDLVRGAGATSE